MLQCNRISIGRHSEEGEVEKKDRVEVEAACISVHGIRLRKLSCSCMLRPADEAEVRITNDDRPLLHEYNLMVVVSP